MKVYSIGLNANASGDQVLLIDKLKSSGFEVIQASSGLLTKSEKNSEQDLQKILLEISPQLTFSLVDLSDPELAKDAKIFAGLKASP